MKKLKLSVLLILSIISTQGFALCRYDLEGFLPEPANPAAQKFPTASGQKVSYKILNAPNQITYSATHSNFSSSNNIATGTLPIANMGIVGFEFNIDTISNELTGTNNIGKGMNLLMFDQNNQTMGVIAIMYGNNSAIQNYKKPLLIWVMQKNPITNQNDITYAYLQPYDASTTQNVGVYINQNANQIGFILNKQNLGYVATINSKIKSLTFQPQALFSGFEANSPYLNKTMSLELVTDKSKFTNTFPTGTKDACGN